MGHCDDCAVLETLVHRLVNDRFRRHVDVGRRLVNQNDSGWLQNGAGNADQLSLTNAEVLSVFGDLGLKALATVHRFLESGSLKGAVQVLVSVLLKRVKVLANGACEETGVLQNDGDFRAEVVEAQLRNVAAVEHDFSVSGFEDAQEAQHDGRLAGTRSSDDSDLVAAGEGDIESSQHEVQVLAVPTLEVDEVYSSFVGPTLTVLSSLL